MNVNDVEDLVRRAKAAEAERDGWRRDCLAAVEREQALRKMIAKARRVPRGSWCVECGPNVGVDEDGCCGTCGSVATGPYADRALALLELAEHWQRSAQEVLIERDAARAEVERLKSERKESVIAEATAIADIAVSHLVRAEREACAEVAECAAFEHCGGNAYDTARAIAAAIRARACVVDPILSRSCELGTKSCGVKHGGGK